jgi:hypothetical protein
MADPNRRQRARALSIFLKVVIPVAGLALGILAIPQVREVICLNGVTFLCGQEDIRISSLQIFSYTLVRSPLLKGSPIDPSEITDANPELQQRSYGSRFPRVGDTYLYWDLFVEYPTLKRPVDFTIHAISYMPDHYSTHESEIPCHLDPNEHPVLTDFEARSKHVTGILGLGALTATSDLAPGTYSLKLILTGSDVNTTDRMVGFSVE